MTWRMVALWVLSAASAEAGDVLVDVLDVGQGDSILIRGGGKTVLIDAGDRPCNSVEQLKSLGITHFDLVVATHPHADHIGRMPDVLEDFDVDLYMDNGLSHTTLTYAQTMEEVQEKHIPYQPAQRGTKIPMGDEATFTVLFPDQGGKLTDTRSDLNANSVVLRLDHGENSFLFTGDSEEPTEQRLLADGLQPVDVLKVAHHGSQYSTTQAFLDAVKPTYALISVGTDNRYGHPGPDTLARLVASGAMVYRTDLSGDLRVVSDGRHLEVLEGPLDELQTLAIQPWSADLRVATQTPPSPPTRPQPAPAPVVPTATPEPKLTAKEQRKLDRAKKKAARAEARAKRLKEKVDDLS
jgi:beta-lactamase superfamily II metal-dependent hydrolase